MNKFVALLLTVLIFVVVGPGIGTLAVFIGSGFAEIMRSANYGIDILIRGLGFVMFFGYIFGWAFALVAGLFVAITGIWFRWNSFLAPIAAAVVSTLSGALLVPTIFQIRADPSGVTWFFPACLLATLVCWFLTRGIVRKTWQSA
jgi:hypothetical protein